MADLAGHVRDYLELRRALGFKLVQEGHILPELVAYAEAAGASTLTTELAVSWACQRQGVQPITWAHRLGAARGFARYLKTIDPATEVPPPGILRARQERLTPYLWSKEEIIALLEATRQIRPELRAATHETLFGLIAATGMRLGEATGLQRKDVNLADGILTITEAKFDLSRLIPLHPSTAAALPPTPSAGTGSAPHPAVPHSSSRTRGAPFASKASIQRSTTSRLGSGCAPPA